jgi:DNA-binding XRE family transcriptional regulator
MDKLLTQKDLAARWQVTEKAISNWRAEGTLTTCKGVPVIRFSEQYIAELEGLKIEKFSPLERRRIERELEEKVSAIQLKDKEIAELKAKIAQILSIGATVIYSKEAKQA